MNKQLAREYRKQRKSWPASTALSRARLEVAWWHAEDESVRITTEPDVDWEHTLDFDCESPTCPIPYRCECKQHREQRERLERDGAWILVSHAKLPCGHWEPVDSIGGFIGDDWQGSGYDHDVKAAALDAAGIDY